MLIVTTTEIVGSEITETLGLVRGTTVCSDGDPGAASSAS